MVTFTLAGRGQGLSALLAATLLSDFFFVEPTFVFSLDWQVFRLSLVYLPGAAERLHFAPTIFGDFARR